MPSISFWNGSESCLLSRSLYRAPVASLKSFTGLSRLGKQTSLDFAGVRALIVSLVEQFFIPDGVAVSENSPLKFWVLGSLIWRPAPGRVDIIV